MRSLRPDLLAACLLCVRIAHAGDACHSGKGEMPAPAPGWQLTWENDSIGPGETDEFYTQGFRFGYRMHPAGEPRFLSWIMDGICRSVAANSGPGHRKLVGAASFFLGQHFFTPGDITIPELIPDDRPYAAWLYLGSRLELAQKYDEPGRFARGGLFHTFEFQVGTLGPRAQGKWVQSHWHDTMFSDAPQPRGWDNQLDNEWGVQLRYNLRGLITDVPLGEKGWQLQGTLDGDFNLGSVLDSVSVGTTWRIGRHLSDPVGLGLQPTFKREGGDTPCLGSWIEECHLFVGVTGHGVGYNALMDGEIFHGGHHVEKDPFFGEFNLGMRLGWKRLQLDVTRVQRESEFVRPPSDSHSEGKHRFYAFNLRCVVVLDHAVDRYEAMCPGALLFLSTILASRNP